MWGPRGPKFVPGLGLGKRPAQILSRDPFLGPRAPMYIGVSELVEEMQASILGIIYIDTKLKLVFAHTEVINIPCSSPNPKILNT